MARREDAGILRALIPVTIVDIEAQVFWAEGRTERDLLRDYRERLLEMRAVYSVAALARVICQNDALRTQFKMWGKEESVREILARAKGVKENGAFIVPRPKV
jgi:hypothetical protein